MNKFQVVVSLLLVPALIVAYEFTHSSYWLGLLILTQWITALFALLYVAAVVYSSSRDNKLALLNTKRSIEDKKQNLPYVVLCRLRAPALFAYYVYRDYPTLALLLLCTLVLTSIAEYVVNTATAEPVNAN